MNVAFTKRKKIILDDSWYLVPDSDNGIVLVFHEYRDREKIVKENGKQEKTGEVEKYLFEEKFYFTRIVQALREYVEETQNSSKSLEELFKRQEKIELILETIDKEFKQFK